MQRACAVVYCDLWRFWLSNIHKVFIFPYSLYFVLRPILVSLCGIEQMNYGVFNLIYYNSKI